MAKFRGPTGNIGLDIARGEMQGYSLVHKFGNILSVSTTAEVDVYSPGIAYPYPAAGLTLQVASQDDAGDTAEITVEGLDSDFNPITGKVNLNGKTPVNVTDSAGGALLFYRINRAYNSGDVDFNGVVRGADTATTWTSGVPTSTDVLLEIDTNAQQTMMAIYTIPAGKQGFIPRVHASVSAEGGAALTASFAMRLALQIRLVGGVFRTQHAETCIKDGNSQAKTESPFPLGPLSAGTDIRWFVTNNTLDATGVDAGFTVLLWDEIDQGE